ncbi:MAG: hypothetical protein GXP59_00875 [Deltaproteobacteria bacterium]|nr:hypothetical protein [Deltaproteobacteria bacterium]
MLAPKKANQGPTIILLLLALIAMPGCHRVSPVQFGEKISWHDLANGRIEAAKLKRPCLVDFYYGPKCPRCSAFARNIYTDPDIISRLSTQFVAIRVDLRKPLTPAEQALANAMKTSGECMLMFLDSRGRIVKTRHGGPICTMGTLTVTQFSAYLDRTLSRLHNGNQGASEPN